MPLSYTLAKEKKSYNKFGINVQRAEFRIGKNERMLTVQLHWKPISKMIE